VANTVLDQKTRRQVANKQSHSLISGGIGCAQEEGVGNEEVCLISDALVR
jgi:hypothetical protein